MMKTLIKEKNFLEYLQINKNDLLKDIKIKIEIVENNIDIYNSIARTMTNKLVENNQKGNNTSFILPVGPKGQYRRFVKICNSENISCRNLITINMDEYLDINGKLISENHPLSFRKFMKNNLFMPLNKELKIKSENIYFPNPNNISEIGNLLNELNGADICFGGIGINGHIAFNEPMTEGEIEVGEYRELKTRILNVSRETIVINSIQYGGNIKIIPKKCITIGMSEIFRSKQLKFYLEHNWQSSVLKRTLFEKPKPSFPATFLKEHENCTITVSENVLDNYTN